MRRLLFASTLLLTGCANSGYWRFVGDTATLPGANPNRPTGSSETYAKVRHKETAPVESPPPLLTQAGDVWPGNPKPVPTLRDLQRQQSVALGANGLGSNTPVLAPLPPLPVLPGFETPPQLPSEPPPEPSFPNQRVTTPSGPPMHFGTPQNYRGVPGGANGRESIVVPNGNGTSTVIGPNGEVSTIPTPAPK